MGPGGKQVPDVCWHLWTPVDGDLSVLKCFQHPVACWVSAKISFSCILFYYMNLKGIQSFTIPQSELSLTYGLWTSFWVCVGREAEASFHSPLLIIDVDLGLISESGRTSPLFGSPREVKEKSYLLLTVLDRGRELYASPDTFLKTTPLPTTALVFSGPHHSAFAIITVTIKNLFSIHVDITCSAIGIQ